MALREVAKHNQKTSDDDHRKPFELDKKRVIHTFPFRRLQGKFQMISGSECDFNRNRLTHSIEVASLAKNIYLKIRDDVNMEKDVNHKELRQSYLLADNNLFETASLLETISLLHDIGNPPFGHAGEVALNFKMHNDGGFEGNAQALHMLSQGNKYFPLEEFDLTKRTLLGILKYPASYYQLCKTTMPNTLVSNRKINHQEWEPPKCYYDSEIDIVSKLLRDGPKIEFTSFRPPEKLKNEK